MSHIYLFFDYFFFEYADTGEDKGTIKAYAHRLSYDKNEVKYESKFVVPPGFGGVGAILVENEHHKEIYLKDIVLNGFQDGPINVTCNSWVHSKFDDKTKRIFFTHKVGLNLYLPTFQLVKILIKKML